MLKTSSRPSNWGREMSGSHGYGAFPTPGLNVLATSLEEHAGPKMRSPMADKEAKAADSVTTSNNHGQSTAAMN